MCWVYKRADLSDVALGFLGLWVLGYRSRSRGPALDHGSAGAGHSKIPRTGKYRSPRESFEASREPRPTESPFTFHLSLVTGFVQG